MDEDACVWWRDDVRLFWQVTDQAMSDGHFRGVRNCNGHTISAREPQRLMIAMVVRDCVDTLREGFERK